MDLVEEDQRDLIYKVLLRGGILTYQLEALTRVWNDFANNSWPR
jgi:hypothetical protein